MSLSTTRSQIGSSSGHKGRCYQKTLRRLKKGMNHYIRRCNKIIDDDDIGYKKGRKPYLGWYD